MKNNKYWKPNLPELRIAIIGANGSGKSALTVKYITRRYIGEYDPNLEDTYCKRDTINNREYMVWIMDTVEGASKDPNRYIPWADIYIVVYSITNRLSFEYAEELLEQIKDHEHAACRRQHITHVVGNKCDMERYRQVSKTKGAELAAQYGGEFTETNCTEEYGLIKPIFHGAIQQAQNPAPRNVTKGKLTKQHSGTGGRKITGRASEEPNASRNPSGQSTSGAQTVYNLGKKHSDISVCADSCVQEAPDGSDKPGNGASDLLFCRQNTGSSNDEGFVRPSNPDMVISLPCKPTTGPPSSHGSQHTQDGDSSLSSPLSKATDKSTSSDSERSLTINRSEKMGASLTASGYSTATMPVTNFTKRLLAKSSSDRGVVAPQSGTAPSSSTKKSSTGLKWFKRFQS